MRPRYREIGRHPHVPLRHDSVGPQHIRHVSRPLGRFARTGLEQRVPYVEMGPFNDAVRLRVVARYADVIDMVPLCQVVERFHKRCAIVRYDLRDCTPPAK